MVSEKQQNGRWLRIGALTLTTFMPLLTSISSRFFRRDQGEYTARNAGLLSFLAAKNGAKTKVRESETIAPEKLQALGAALVDALDDLRARTRPYGQELRKRSMHVAGAVRERGNEISHLVAERGAYLTRDFPTRRDLQARLERRKGFWISLGFGLGLAVTGILTFRLIRRRQQEQQAELLAELGYLGSHIELTPSSNGQAHRSMPARQPTAATTAPSDATFLGLVSNKHYYPIETPLDQLALSGGRPVDIVYFSSEEEALAQGFSAAR